MLSLLHLYTVKYYRARDVTFPHPGRERFDPGYNKAPVLSASKRSDLVPDYICTS